MVTKAEDGITSHFSSLQRLFMNQSPDGDWVHPRISAASIREKASCNFAITTSPLLSYQHILTDYLMVLFMIGKFCCKFSRFTHSSKLWFVTPKTKKGVVQNFKEIVQIFINYFNRLP